MIRRGLLILGALASAGGALRAEGASEPAAAMAKAANSFLATLDSAKRAKARLPFNSEERLNWHFVPRERQGVSIKQMSSEERGAALTLLRSGLSARGFTKVDTIVHLEEVLFVIEGSAIRDPELYYFTVFGEPSERGSLGLAVRGPPRLAQLDGREWTTRGQHAAVPGREPGRRSRGAAEGNAGAGLGGGSGARPRHVVELRPERAGRPEQERPQGHSHRAIPARLRSRRTGGSPTGT